MTVVFPLFPRARCEGRCPAAGRLAGLLLVTACLVLSCREKPTEPPPKPPPVAPGDSLGVELALLEKGVSDAVLEISIPDTNTYRYVELFRDGKRILTMNIAGKEKTVEDSALSPGATYTYHALRLSLKSDSFPSAPLRVTTLPLTSHAFQWRIDTLGESGSYLRGVAIAGDGTIWAGGEVYQKDSILWDNAVVWSGSRWEYRKVYFPYDCGRPEIAAGEISAVLKGTDGKIWFTNGASMAYWENNVFSMLCIPSTLALGHIYAMYIDSGRHIYAAGGVGSMGFWNGSIYGSIWTREPTETTLGLTDIAEVNGQLFSCGWDRNYNGVILQKSGDYWKTVMTERVTANGFNSSELFKTQLYSILASLWCDERGTMYAAGFLVYRYRKEQWDFVRSFQDNPWTTKVPHGFINTVRGNASNDIFLFGERNTILHFNGATWAQIGPPYDFNSPIVWLSCAASPNLVVGVGTSNTDRKALVIRLWR